jgi:hypothetical protein
VAKATVEYVPATQFVHDTLLAEDHEPAAQFEQELAPAGDHRPAAHKVHDKAPEAENDPAVQLEHPLPSTNVPAPHVLIEQAGPLHAEELQTQTP